MKFIRIALSLAKIHITLPVTASAFTGFIIYEGSFSIILAPLLTGVLLLAAGSSALNHYQEKETDRLMERTRKRPIPDGSVSPLFVLIFSIVLLMSGSLLLFSFFKPPVMLLGIFNFFWYNAVYTPLKKITAFAVIPGSVIGGVPPMIGWVAAGGSISDPEIVVVVLFFILGQVPHFWLLLLRYGKEYELAGLPSLTTVLTTGQISRLSYAWIVATVAASALLPAFGLISLPVLIGIYFLVTLSLLLYVILHNLRGITGNNSRIPFNALNIYYLVIMGILVMNVIMAR